MIIIIGPQGNTDCGQLAGYLRGDEDISDQSVAFGGRGEIVTYQKQQQNY